MRNRSDRFDQALTAIFLLFAVVAIVVSAQSLYVYPIPDSARYWFGDESWLMLEARTQIVEGMLRQPYAFGATLGVHAGVVMGSTWLCSLVYGVPAALFASKIPIVDIGRTITFGISIVALFEFGWLLLGITKKKWLSAFGIAILATSPAFVIASHSARPDILIGLVLLVVVAFFAKRVKKPVVSTRAWLAIGGGLSLLALTISAHLITLLFPFSIFALFRLGILRNLKFPFAAVFGAIAACALITLVYYLTTGDLSLYGTHGQHVQFIDVANQKPIMRPFSRSVQWNNLTQRASLLWDGAPAITIIFLFSILAGAVNAFRGKKKRFANHEFRFIGASTIIILFSWLLFQTSIAYYLPHFLVLGLFTTIVLFDRVCLSELGDTSFKLGAQFFLNLLFLKALIFDVQTTSSSAKAGRLLRDENQNAEQKLYTRIDSDARMLGISHPLVLLESPGALQAEGQTSFRIMSPLFPAFPERDEPVVATLDRYGVRYALLYETPLRLENGASHNALLEGIESRGVLIDTAIGTLFDMGRDYLDPHLETKDTLKLYRLNVR